MPIVIKSTTNNCVKTLNKLLLLQKCTMPKQSVYKGTIQILCPAMDLLLQAAQLKTHESLLGF